MAQRVANSKTQENWTRFRTTLTKTIHYLAFALALCDFVISLG
jgi:hypothetical protein